MDIEFRQLRCFVAVVDEGTFTDAGISLGISQTAVSRNLAVLEEHLGVRLIHRTTRSVSLTEAGERAVAHARRVLAAVVGLERAVEGGGRLRLGYTWSALGRHTSELQRRWAAECPDTELELVMDNSPTAGLLEGACDVAILRRVPAAGLAVRQLELRRIGAEKRYCAMAADDPLAGRRSVGLAQIADKPLAVDVRTGSTTLELWPAESRPAKTFEIHSVDDWLTLISSGRARGVTAEATAHQYRRRGLVYRPVRDAPPVPVHAAWVKGGLPAVGRKLIGLLEELYSSGENGERQHGDG
ncbi:LysR family transcriptional regulator [Arthrobacter celericrescens]|uniref:LysR family transcriptional regulator n=1 Tax=Arthrobacter celericrescens TaxID=2320851 RepID=UPI000EA269CA|nr:LysR family transcriptional regulator [Arthrobacter celericrescens]